MDRNRRPGHSDADAARSRCASLAGTLGSLRQSVSDIGFAGISQAEHLELPHDCLLSARDCCYTPTGVRAQGEISSRICFDERSEITALTVVLYCEFLKVPDLVRCCIGTKTGSRKPAIICCEYSSAGSLKSVSTVVLF